MSCLCQSNAVRIPVAVTVQCSVDGTFLTVISRKFLRLFLVYRNIEVNSRMFEKTINLIILSDFILLVCRNSLFYFEPNLFIEL